MLRRAKADDAAVDALMKAIAAFGSQEGVTGIDLGVRLKDHETAADDGPVIRIHVRRKRSRRSLGAEAFPKTFEGLPIDVIQARYTYQTGPGVGVGDAAATLQPGLSVSHAQGSEGTLGMLVRGNGKDNKSVYVLSADHVLADVGNPQANDPIIQPGRESSGSSPGDRFAGLSRRSLAHDAAVAKCDAGSGRANSNQVVNSTEIIQDADFPFIGMILHKHGIATQLTSAEVDGIGVYDQLGHGIHLKPVNSDPGADPISAHGDSGAIWFDPHSMRAIGLHVRGNAVAAPHEQFAIATSVPMLCDALKVSPRL